MHNNINIYFDLESIGSFIILAFFPQAKHYSLSASACVFQQYRLYLTPLHQAPGFEPLSAHISVLASHIL